MVNRRKIRRVKINGIMVALTAMLLTSGCSQAGEGQQLQSDGQESVNTAVDEERENAGKLTDSSQDGLQTEGDGQRNEELTIRTPAPMILPTHWQDNRYSEKGELLAEGSFQAFEISGEGYETAAEAIQEWFRGVEKGFALGMDELEEQAKEHREYALEDELPFYSYYSKTEYDVSRVDNSVISVSCLQEDYYGGAHGLYGTTGTTFDAQTGERLSFWDLTTNQEEFSQRTLDYCLKRVKEGREDMLFGDYEETIRRAWEEEPNWYLDGAGITIVFMPYELGPFVMGEVRLTVPYQEVEDVLLEKYQVNNQAGVYVLPQQVEAKVSLGEASGEKETIELFNDSNDQESYGLQTYLLRVEEKTEKLAEMDRLIRAYLLQEEDGRSFLLFYGDMASDDYVTYLYELTTGDIRKVQEEEAGACIQTGSVNTQSFTLGIRVDALGTYMAYGDYGLTEDGSFEPKGEWYTISQSSVLTNTKELPVVVNGQKKLLPAGSRIQITGTNREGILRYQMMDSVEDGEIHFTLGEGGWPVYIDGAMDTEYFENLPYVG